jgi:hypothetical protein
VTQLVLLIILFVLQVSGYQGNLIPMIASVTSFLLVLSIMYWFHMFKNLAMYSRVIQNAIWETRYFLVLVFIIVFAFGMAWLSLDNGLLSISDDDNFQPLMEDSSFPIITYIISQYLLVLGEW